MATETKPVIPHAHVHFRVELANGTVVRPKEDYIEFADLKEANECLKGLHEKGLLSKFQLFNGPLFNKMWDESGVKDPDWKV
jgi:hypothetical protein